jgi:predicted transcriptional regulator
LIGKVNTQKILNKEEVEVEKESTAEEVIEALEKDISVGKLTEKNMLGRLAKSMELNEENKTKLFDYFDKGELEQ